VTGTPFLRSLWLAPNVVFVVMFSGILLAMWASKSIRGWLPFGVVALLIIGVPGAIVVGVLVYERTGVAETPVDPQVVRLGTDPRTISVGVTWLEGGWCLGEFEARATETSSEVRVGMVHRQFTHGGACAGVGTVYNIAWADLTLKAPIGSRSVVRSSDRAPLPVLRLDDRFLRKDAVGADIKQYGGLNDDPPLGLKKEIRISDPRTLENLATALDSLPPFPPGTISCPLDDGSYYLVQLNYIVGGNASLKINARGCQGVYLDASTKPIAWALPATVNIFNVLTTVLGE
jgi:hypothetical protein